MKHRGHHFPELPTYRSTRRRLSSSFAICWPVNSGPAACSSLFEPSSPTTLSSPAFCLKNLALSRSSTRAQEHARFAHPNRLSWPHILVDMQPVPFSCSFPGYGDVAWGCQGRRTRPPPQHVGMVPVPVRRYTMQPLHNTLWTGPCQLVLSIANKCLPSCYHYKRVQVKNDSSIVNPPAYNIKCPLGVCTYRKQAALDSAVA